MRENPERVAEILAEAIEHNGPTPTAAEVRETVETSEERRLRFAASATKRIVALIDEATERTYQEWHRLSEEQRDEIRHALEALRLAIDEEEAPPA